MDTSQCSKDLLLKIANNEISFDAMDATRGLMTYEATYANFDKSVGIFHKECRQGRRGLYLQVSFYLAF